MCGGGRSYSPPPPPPPPPPVEDAVSEEQKVARDKHTVALKARGRKSNIVTGALGDTSAPNVGKNELLGQ